MPNPETKIMVEEAMESPALSKTLSGESGFGLDEWHARVELAACFRLMAKFKMTDLTATHACVTIPGSEHILINSFGLLMEEITASNLVKMDFDGNILSDNKDPPVSAGFAIHSVVHRARPDIVCSIHTHTKAGTGVASLECGLLPLNQMSLIFYDRIAYNQYEYLIEVDECDQLVSDLGDKKAMIMLNHGLLTAGRSVGEAFILMYFLDRACQIQLDAMATGEKLVTPSPELCEEAARRWMDIDGHAFGEVEWQALKRQLDQEEPSYKA